MHGERAITVQSQSHLSMFLTISKMGIHSARMRMDGAVDSPTGVKNESADTQAENDLRKWAELETSA